MIPVAVAVIVMVVVVLLMSMVEAMVMVVVMGCAVFRPPTTRPPLTGVFWWNNLVVGVQFYGFWTSNTHCITQ